MVESRHSLGSASTVFQGDILTTAVTEAMGHLGSYNSINMALLSVYGSLHGITLSHGSLGQLQLYQHGITLSVLKTWVTWAATIVSTWHYSQCTEAMGHLGSYNSINMALLSVYGSLHGITLSHGSLGQLQLYQHGITLSVLKTWVT